MNEALREGFSEQNYKLISIYISRRVGFEFVDDLTQEVFLRAWNRMDSYTQIEGIPVVAYLYKIAHNLIVDNTRGANSMANIDDFANIVTTGRSVEDEVLHMNEIEALVQAVETLPNLTQREILKLKYGADLPEKQIEDMLGMNRGAISMNATRAKRQLRIVLDESS